MVRLVFVLAASVWGCGAASSQRAAGTSPPTERDPAASSDATGGDTTGSEPTGGATTSSDATDGDTTGSDATGSDATGSDFTGGAPTSGDATGSETTSGEATGGAATASGEATTPAGGSTSPGADAAADVRADDPSANNCSCCGLVGGANQGPERDRARREAYRACVARGGGCGGGCPRPPSARPRP